MALRRSSLRPSRSLVRVCPLLGRPVSSSQIKCLSRTKEASQQTLSEGKARTQVGSKFKQKGLGLTVTGFGSQKSHKTESHQLSQAHRNSSLMLHLNVEIKAYILVLNVLYSQHIYTWMQTLDTAENSETINLQSGMLI